MFQRIALVPHFNPYDGWWDGVGLGKGNDRNNDQFGDEQEIDMSLSPEESWMYDSNSFEQERVVLESFDSNHHATILVGNDSVGALKLNLSANHRTTFCITMQNLDQVNGTDISADIYLLTSSEYNKYEESYLSTHGQTAEWYGEVEQSLSDIAPEWRSLNFLGWKTYRDSHQYENVDKINFALSLDGPEVYSGLFGESDWEDFYIVIDTWDNVHDNDAPPSNAIIAADVTIITTERTFILPNFTVSLVFLALIITLAIFPFILNARYMRAGLEVEQTSSGLIPSLSNQSEIPPPVVENNRPDVAVETTIESDVAELDEGKKDFPEVPEI